MYYVQCPENHKHNPGLQQFSSHNNINILRATIVDSNSLILNGSKINFALCVLITTSPICLSAHDIN